MLPQDLPELAIVRVLTAGGPYAVDDCISVAFVTPTVGRLVPHRSIVSDVRAIASGGFVPDTISVRVTHAAGPYDVEAVLALSFVDPRIARIHPTGILGGVERAPDATRSADAGTVRPKVPAVEPLRHDEARRRDDDLPDDRARAANEAVRHVEDAIARAARPALEGVAIADDTSGEVEIHASPLRIAPPSSRSADPASEVGLAISGVCVRLHWHPERVRRFIQVADKLFTIERLGWYRHLFAMRLLVPDGITCGDAGAEIEAMRHLVALRAAAVETLGKPLLAAFMPNFVVTSEWLDELDNPAEARALAGVCEAIEPFLRDDIPTSAALDDSCSVGFVTRGALARQPASTVESMLPLFIASDTRDAQLTERLNEYRRTLVDVFGQTSGSAEAVRLTTMTLPNHALDDRLWRLVSAVGGSLGGLAVA